MMPDESDYQIHGRNSTMRTIEEIRGTPPGSRQEVFDRVVDFFFGHRKPRAYLDAIGWCSYRTTDSACAIGCQLPDYIIESLTNERLLYSSVAKLMERSAEVANWFQGMDLSFLYRIQKAHDNEASSDGFRHALTVVASGYSLDMSTLSSYDNYCEYAGRDA